MKKISHFSLAILVIILIASCSQPKQESLKGFDINGKVYIEGKVLNLEKADKQTPILLIHHNYLESQKVEKIKTDSTGKFQVELEWNYPKFFFLYYGSMATFICKPGDSIYIEIDATIFENKKNEFPGNNFFARIIKNNRSLDNKYMGIYIKEYTKIIKKINLREVQKNLTQTRFFKTLDSIFSEIETLTDSLTLISKSELFHNWAHDLHNCDKLLIKMRYKPNNDSNQITHNAIKENIINEVYFNNSIYSFYHEMLLQDIYVYLIEISKNKNIDPIKLISEKTSGCNKDIILSKYIYEQHKRNNNLDNGTLDKITNLDLRQFLSNKIKAGTEKKAALLKRQKRIPYIDSLVSKHKNKVLYIDFWATWCGPCKNQMKYSKELSQKYKNNAIQFIYLACRSNIEDWKSMMQDSTPNEDHYFLSNNQYSELADVLKISGVPHYILVNKKGGIINNAPRPSNKKIEDEIKQLLNE